MATSQDTYPEHSHQFILIAYIGERPRIRYRNFGPFPSKQDAIDFKEEYKKKYTSPGLISQWLIDPLCNPLTN